MKHGCALPHIETLNFKIDTKAWTYKWCHIEQSHCSSIAVAGANDNFNSQHTVNKVLIRLSKIAHALIFVNWTLNIFDFNRDQDTILMHPLNVPFNFWTAAIHWINNKVETKITSMSALNSFGNTHRCWPICLLSCAGKKCLATLKMNVLCIYTKELAHVTCLCILFSKSLRLATTPSSRWA